MKTFRIAPLKYILVVCVVLGVHIFSEAKIYDKDNCDDEDEDSICIDCEIKKMSGSSLKINQATLDHFFKGDKEDFKSEKHTKENLQVFHCQCVHTVRIFCN